MRILVLHGQREVVASLQVRGFEVDGAVDDLVQYDGVVVDADQLAEVRRRVGWTAPVLVLTTSDDPSALVQYGADDWLVVPVAADEVAERVVAMCRPPVEPVRRAAPAQLDEGERAAFELLAAGAVVTRERLGGDDVITSLRNHGLQIETVRGVGFRLRDE